MSKKEQIKNTSITIGPITDDKALKILKKLPEDVDVTVESGLAKDVVQTAEEPDEKKMNYIDALYHHGFATTNPGLIMNIRRDNMDEFYNNCKVCSPNPDRDMFESECMSQDQRMFLNTMRMNNAVMAEYLTESFRRGLTALLEYNTQAASNVMYHTMCEIIDKEK